MDCNVKYVRGCVVVVEVWDGEERHGVCELLVILRTTFGYTKLFKNATEQMNEWEGGGGSSAGKLGGRAIMKRELCDFA